jgi:hypothetical protein
VFVMEEQRVYHEVGTKLSTCFRQGIPLCLNILVGKTNVNYCFYRCTVRFEDSLSITHQQLH